jgi:tRNA(fMet)-specific endonuclease VapC
MSGKLLDTNAVIALQASDPAILALFDADDEMLVPAVVIGELYYGAYNSERVDANLAVIDDFIEANTVLACDAATAKEYGQIKHGLRVKGQPIPENDIWVAALARQHSLTVVTRDEHFKPISGLSLETW